MFYVALQKEWVERGLHNVLCSICANLNHFNGDKLKTCYMLQIKKAQALVAGLWDSGIANSSMASSILAIKEVSNKC